MTTSVIAPERRRTTDDELNARLWELVDEIQADLDHSAGPFGELYRLTHGTVFRCIRSRIGSHHDAEDLAAEVYVRARRRIGRLVRSASSPAAWLVTIARNLVADHYGSARVRLVVPVPAVDGRFRDGRPAAGETYDRTAADAAEIRAAVVLYGALSRLTVAQREAVRLRYLLGESVAGTADEMGKDEGAIKALTYRATRAMLRDPAVAELAGAWSRLAA